MMHLGRPLRSVSWSQATFQDVKDQMGVFED